MDKILQSLFDRMSSMEKGSFQQLIRDKYFQQMLEVGFDKFIKTNSNDIVKDTKKQANVFMDSVLDGKNAIFYLDDLLTLQINAVAVRLNENKKTSLIDDSLNEQRDTFLHTPTGLTLDSSLSTE